MEYIVKGETMEKLNWMIDEVEHRLEAEKQNHDVVRLVVPEECREIRICGEEFSYGRPCFNIWGATSRCYTLDTYFGMSPVSIYGVPRLVAATAPVIRRIIQGNGFLKRSGWGNCCVWWSQCRWLFPVQEGQ